MTMMEEALSYAEAGFAVLPLVERKKIPLTSHGLKDATQEPEIIKSWWSKWPRANIGIATGKKSGGLFVIDCDVDEGKNGVLALAEWELDNGFFPETACSITGRGGKHYLFRSEKVVKNRTGFITGVDLRGEGGYIVAPPSIHENGTAYSWQADPRSAQIAEADEIVFRFLNQVQDAPREAQEQLEGDVIESGSRVNTLVSLVGSMKGKGAPDDVIKAAVEEMNKNHCSPPLTGKELEREVFPALSNLKPGDPRYSIMRDFDEIPAGLEPWDSPVPFELIEAPDFPVECLPYPMASFVGALAESTQTPPEMASVLSLGVLATAFQSRFEVEINTDWKEPLCLYTVAVASPGERKSSVIAALTRPIYDYEAMRHDLEKDEIEQNRQRKRMLEMAVDNAEKAATKAMVTTGRKGKKNESDAAPESLQSQAQQRAIELNDELTNFKEMYPFRLLVDDTTPEKLVDIMDKHEGCITVASAEGGVFDSLAGRYDKGASFDVYLKGHAGDPIIVDRIGRKANYIKKPRLTMILTIQPDVLSGLMDNPTLRGRGLCGRFMYAVCKSKVGNRKIDPETIPQAVKDEYQRFIQRIVSGTESGIIHLSKEAQRLQLKYSALVERRLGNEWEFMKDWGGKAVGAMLRIAALIHASECLEDPSTVPISADVVTRAVNIVEALGVHAMAAYQVMGADKDLEEARYLWKRIESTGQERISKRDLIRLCHGKFKKAEEMEPAMQVLVEMNYIQRIYEQTRGKPKEFIILNPVCL